MDFGLSFFGSSDDEERFRGRSLPMELNYDILRRELWLATDGCYKQTAEVFSKKESSLKNKQRNDTTEDFKLLPPQTTFTDIKEPICDLSKFNNICKEVSAVFLDYPAIYNSSVSIEYLPKNLFYLNSEGREFSLQNHFAGIEVVAYTQAKDGMPLTETYFIYSKNPDELPSIDSLKRGAKQIADKLMEIANSEKLAEPYSGPVLFSGEASSMLIAQHFAPNLAVQRQVLSEGGFGGGGKHSAFQNKIGGRVLPEYISVFDKPKESKYNGTSLCGTYETDDEGTPSQNIKLVEKGYLETLLSSRVPTRKIKESNGHFREGGAMISNIIIESEKTNSYQDLVKKAQKLAKGRDLPFVIVVKKVLDLNLFYTNVYRASKGDYPYFQADNLSRLLEVVKVMPDGKETLLRGVELANFTTASFKDIIDCGNKQNTINILAPSIASPYMTGGSSYIASSITCPDLLFEDCEIRNIDGDYPKLPIVAKPIIKN